MRPALPPAPSHRSLMVIGLNLVADKCTPLIDAVAVLLKFKGLIERVEALELRSAIRVREELACFADSNNNIEGLFVVRHFRTSLPTIALRLFILGSAF